MLQVATMHSISQLSLCMYLTVTINCAYLAMIGIIAKLVCAKPKVSKVQRPNVFDLVHTTIILLLACCCRHHYSSFRRVCECTDEVLNSSGYEDYQVEIGYLGIVIQCCAMAGMIFVGRRWLDWTTTY